MPETRFTEFPALSVNPWVGISEFPALSVNLQVGISLSESETDALLSFSPIIGKSKL